MRALTRIDAINAGALCAALIASALGAGSASGENRVRVEQVAPRSTAIAEVRMADGSRGVRDASGTPAPLRPYARVASASLIADHVLWELCEPERLVAISDRSKQSATYGYRHHARPAISSPAELEKILALAPDLLFINHFGDPRYTARLRERGIVVFDLGEMQGVSSLLESIEVIGTLLGRPERAAALARTFAERMRAVAADVPAARRPRGLYLSAYGKQLYGGALGTSYHDVLEAAGVIDVAAERYRGWPTFDAEQVLALDPDVLVTKQNMAGPLCAFPGLGQLRACRGRARVVELDAELTDDPGLPMLEVAEQLRTAVHGPR
jgi:iron complex transport system substrate-binding protein